MRELNPRQQRQVQGHIKKLGNAAQEVALRAQRFLITKYGSGAIENLIEACSSPDPQTRFRSVWILGHTRDPRAYDTILTLTKDPDEKVRYDATLALGVLGDERALVPLAEMCREGSELPASEALVKLGLIALPVVQGFIEGNNPVLRLVGSDVLGSISDHTRDRFALDMLRSYQGHPDQDMKSNIEFWIEQIDGQLPEG